MYIYLHIIYFYLIRDLVINYIFHENIFSTNLENYLKE